MGGLCFAEAPSQETESKEGIIARQQRAQKRIAAVKELINTEKTYVEGLQLCIHAYFNRLSQHKKIINTQDLKLIFSDIEMICKLNQTFCDELESRHISFDNNKTMIGDRFLEFTPYFKMYQHYCNQYDSITILLNKYFEKQSFNNILSAIRDKCNGKTLNGLLILPIQRLPRYKLCLSEIIKNTESNHVDLNNLNKALKLVEEITSLINERMKEFEQKKKVRSIESRFIHKYDLILPHRKFIKEGIMTKVDKTGKDRIYIFFLFNDMICYASTKKGKNHTDKSSLKMHTILPIDGNFYIKDIEYETLSFEIHSSVKSFIVHCDNYNKKQKWMKDINEIIEQYMKLHGKEGDKQIKLAAPLMVPDDWSDICQIDECKTKFSFVNRKHHCRYCGKLICAKCGKYKLASKMNEDNVVRVCKPCYDQFCNVYPAERVQSISDDQKNVIVSK